jgi:PAS domain S-box-containing protein
MSLASGRPEHDVTAALRESEQRYRTLFEQAPVGVFLYDKQLRILDFNARCPEILRTEPERLRGLDMHVLRDQRIFGALERALAGEPSHYEGPYDTTMSEARIHVSMRCAPLRDGHGEIVGGMGLVGDITLRAQAEAALRTSEQRFRTLIEGAPDAVGVYSHPSRRIVYGNIALARLLGYETVAEIIGLAIDDRVHPEDRKTLARRKTMLADARTPLAPQEYRMLRKDGSVVHVEVASMLLDDYDGKPSFITFARDLTDRKLMQARLLLADRLASVGTLAAGVAHEINNPLAYLMTNLDLVATRRLPELVARLRAMGGPDAGAGPAAEIADEITRCVERIDVAREGAERVRDIVRDLRTFTRTADDEQRLPVDVRRVLDASVNLAWNEIRHRARLVREYDEVPPVLASEARLGQVFLNLLVNAAQALQVGGAADHTIRVRTMLDDAGQVVTEVSDTGPGIPAEVRERIFDPFFTTKPVGVGTGLGLWICQGIVASLGGHITASSPPGGGATFRVALPAAADLESADVRAPRATPPETTHPRHHLLVVDDEAALGRTLAIALSDAFDVTTATSGRAALERLSSGEPVDLVLCDLMMPDVSGMDVYARVVAERPELAGRFVFVTGGAFTDRARTFVDEVGAPVVQKPFRLEALVELLRQRATPARE